MNMSALIAAFGGNLWAVVLDMADWSTISLSLICMHGNTRTHINIMIGSQSVTFWSTTKFHLKSFKFC